MLLLRQGDRDVRGGVCSSSNSAGSLCSSREESVALGLEGKVEHNCGVEVAPNPDEASSRDRKSVV